LQGKVEAGWAGGEKRRFGERWGRGGARKMGGPGRWASEGTLGVDDPFTATQRREPLREVGRVGERSIVTEELQLAGPMRGGKFFEEAAAEEPREHPHREEEPGSTTDPALAIEREPTPGDDAMYMWMMRQRRPPGMEDQRHPDPRAKMLGIGGDGA